MRVKKVVKRTIPELSAKNTDVSGKVTLVAKAVAPSTLDYIEYSLDPSTWTPMPDTGRARIVIPDLTSARVYSFRFRARTRAGWRGYSQVVSLLVHSPQRAPNVGCSPRATQLVAAGRGPYRAVINRLGGGALTAP